VIGEALRLRRGDVVGVVGAGGKTTLCYRLASEARAAGWRVLVTTTTHMGTLPRETTGPVVVEEDGDPRAGLVRALREEGIATLLGRRVRQDKLGGVAPERVDELAALADLTLIEADGARQRSLKTPAPHEPVVPKSATLLVVLAALDVLGRPFSEEAVHRIERVAAVTRRLPGEAVGVDDVVATLCDPQGYPARLRAGLRAGVFLNKVEAPPLWLPAEQIAARLLPPYHFVVAGSARAGEALPWSGSFTREARAAS
jgi:probable selenium-dependent hydroxylase accessory protein YqeC